jgi:hypothetical protein
MQRNVPKITPRMKEVIFPEMSATVGKAVAKFGPDDGSSKLL